MGQPENLEDRENRSNPMRQSGNSTVSESTINSANLSAGCRGHPIRQSGGSSIVSGSTANTSSMEEKDSLSVLGKIHVAQLSKDLREKEKALLKKHAAQDKQVRRKYRIAARELKMKHQRHISIQLQDCVEARHQLRDEISARMTALAENQESSTQTLQESIETDVNAMRGAWAEHKRLEQAEKKSFDKAQALISAQVFHEVRNALSSVIAMSEMASTLQEDAQTTPSDLVSSVNEMLNQIEEVVRYSLTMLNNILDINKIKTGTFEIRTQKFNLTDLMQRATAMQLVKAQVRGVSMKFEPPEGGPCIAFTDKDIVLRIVTNFISVSVVMHICCAFLVFCYREDASLRCCSRSF